MSADWTKTKISRRRMLAMIAGSACYAAHASRPQAATPINAVHVHKTAQVADGLRASATGMFSKHEMDTIGALSEIIIPADAHSPGAQVAGVGQYINEIVAVSKETTKKLWVQGLAAIDKMAKLECGKLFVNCSADQQADLVRRISENEQRPATLEERFFVAVKQSTVDGYYLSEVGIHQDLQYQGNAILAEFPGCSHEEHKAGRKANR